MLKNNYPVYSVCRTYAYVSFFFYRKDESHTVRTFALNSKTPNKKREKKKQL